MLKFRNSLLIITALLITATTFLVNDASARSVFHGKRPTTWGVDDIGPSNSAGEPDVGGGQKDPTSQPNDPDGDVGIALRGASDLRWFVVFAARRLFGVGW